MFEISKIINNSLILQPHFLVTLQIYIQFQKLIFWPADDYSFSLPPPILKLKLCIFLGPKAKKQTKKKNKTKRNLNNDNINLKAYTNTPANNNNKNINKNPTKQNKQNKRKLNQSIQLLTVVPELVTLDCSLIRVLQAPNTQPYYS